MAKLIKVSLHPQQGFSGLYYNVYSNGKLIGTITDHKLADAFKRHKTKIVDVATGHFDSVELKFPADILSDIMEPYVAPKKKRAVKKKFHPPYHVEVWEERDRAIISLEDADDQTVFDLRDAEVSDAFESGYLREKYLEEDMIEIAKSRGLIKKENPPSKYNFKVGDRVYSAKKDDEGTVTYVGKAPSSTGYTDLVTVDWDFIGQKILGPEPLTGTKLKSLKKI